MPPTRVETIKARQFLTRTTRPPKTVRPLADLLDNWANRARALTGTPTHDLAARSLRGQYGRPLRADDVGFRAAHAARVDATTRTLPGSAYRGRQLAGQLPRHLDRGGLIGPSTPWSDRPGPARPPPSPP